MKTLDDIRDQMAETFIGETLPNVFKALDDAQITYNDELLAHANEDGFKAGFDACRKVMSADYDRVVKELEDVKAEVERLDKILRREFSENDELGAEYLGITMVRDENAQLKAEVERLKADILRWELSQPKSQVGPDLKLALSNVKLRDRITALRGELKWYWNTMVTRTSCGTGTCHYVAREALTADDKASNQGESE